MTTSENLGGLLAPIARSHPRRSVPGCYPLIDPITTRYADMDVNGHLNNLALEAMHENIRATMNSRIFPDVYDPSRRELRLVTAQNVVHFLAEGYWPATIRAGIGVGHIGRTSYIAASALFVDDQCISVCDTVLVVLGDNGPVAIPDDARQRLEAMRLRVD